MGEDLGVGQRCRARGTSTSDAPLLASLIRDVEMYDSVCLDDLPPPPLPPFALLPRDPVRLSFTLPHE